jgi:GNAT superfamily N-acetyltransferase
VTEVRRIEPVEAGAVAALWDRMCREMPDGGPLTADGLRNITHLLEACAWHHEAFCLVALDAAEIVGFVVGRLDPGSGLLPCIAGEIEEFHVVPPARGRGISAALARAAVDWLRARDVWTIRTRLCADNSDAQRFWRDQGFVADTVVMSRYRDEAE